MVQRKKVDFLRSIFLPFIILLFSFSSFPFFLVVGCSEPPVVKFPLRFYEIKEEFNRLERETEEGEVLKINFQDTLTLCFLPLTKEDVGILTSVENPERIPLAFYIKETAGIPMRISVMLSRVFPDADCTKQRCLVDDRIIKMQISEKREKLAEGFLLLEREISSTYGTISIRSFALPSQPISQTQNNASPPSSPTSTTTTSSSLIKELISQVRTDEEDFTFAMSVSEAGEVVKVESVIISQKKPSCYSELIIKGKTRDVGITVVHGEKKNKFTGRIRMKSAGEECPQKPDTNISSSLELEEYGKMCDRVVPTSNIELFALRLKELAEKELKDIWIAKLEKISEQFGFFPNELSAIKLFRRIRDAQKKISRKILFLQDSEIKEIIDELESISAELEGVGYSVVSRILLQLSDNFSLVITSPLNRASFLFLKSFIKLEIALLTFLLSLDRELDDTTRGIIIGNLDRNNSTENFLKQVVFALEKSERFLETKDPEIRKKAVELLKKSLVEFAEILLYEAGKSSIGFISTPEGGNIPYIETEAGRTSLFPSGLVKRLFYPESITKIFSGFIEHKELFAPVGFIYGIASALLKSAGKNEEDFPSILLLKRIWERAGANLFKANIKKILEGNIRDFLPAWKKGEGNRSAGQFWFEWECLLQGEPFTSEEFFPEKITCEGEVGDFPHFTEEIVFGEPITEGLTENPFSPTGLEKDGVKTRFPYFIPKDPTFGGNLLVRLSFRFGNSPCGKPRGFLFFLPDGKEGICEFSKFFSLLTTDSSLF